jgi:hypothetical protein
MIPDAATCYSSTAIYPQAEITLLFCNRFSKVMSQVSVITQLSLLRPTTDDALPTPPPISLSSYQLVATKSPSVAATAAASGGGLATDEINLDIPLHHTSLEKLKTMLEFLIGCYAVEMVRDAHRSFSGSSDKNYGSLL